MLVRAFLPLQSSTCMGICWLFWAGHDITYTTYTVGMPPMGERIVKIAACVPYMELWFIIKMLPAADVALTRVCCLCCLMQHHHIPATTSVLTVLHSLPCLVLSMYIHLNALPPAQPFQTQHRCCLTQLCAVQHQQNYFNSKEVPIDDL